MNECKLIEQLNDLCRLLDGGFDAPWSKHMEQRAIRLLADGRDLLTTDPHTAAQKVARAKAIIETLMDQTEATQNGS